MNQPVWLSLTLLILQPGCHSTQTIPPAQRHELAVSGWVQKPGRYSVPDVNTITVADLVSAAGGTTVMKDGKFVFKAALLTEELDVRTAKAVIRFADWNRPIKRLGIDLTRYRGLLIEGHYIFK